MTSRIRSSGKPNVVTGGKGDKAELPPCDRHGGLRRSVSSQPPGGLATMPG
jgi:hypothetical protein